MSDNEQDYEAACADPLANIIREALHTQDARTDNLDARLSLLVARTAAKVRALLADGTTPTEPADELARLRAWKAEAMELLGMWDQVHDALGSPAKLGQSKATASLAAAQRLVAPTEAAANGLEPGEIVAIPADLRDASDGVQWECYFAGYWLPVQADDTARRICRPITEEGQS